MENLTHVFDNAFTFKAQTTRSDFGIGICVWCAACVLGSVASISMQGLFAGGPLEALLGPALFLYVVMLASSAVTLGVRRLVDVGFETWFAFILLVVSPFIPVLNIAVFLFALLAPTNAINNKKEV